MSDLNFLPPYSLRQWLLNITTFLSFALCFLSGSLIDLYLNQAWSHGGTPRVLSIYPPQQDTSPLWMVDTLGLFKRERTELSGQSWSWLCDDAVDPTLGIDDLVVLSEQRLIAIAKSGLYLSTDGGCSFERHQSELSQYALGAISVHPNHESLAIYSDSIGRENRVWWSEDAGRTWQQSSFSVNGTIYKLWRNPQNPMELWLNHAQGLSRSQDGGKNFEAMNTPDYGLGLLPNEVRLLGGGQLGEYQALFLALNRFPTASLLLSVNQGASWRAIHQAEDSYDDLVLSSNTLWVSTPFEGLFTFSLGESERLNTADSWLSDRWIQDEDLFISCLSQDPNMENRVWSCGRATPSNWLIAYSDDQALTWQIEMDAYGMAANTPWACSETAPSRVACQRRCLDDDCDPSGLNPPQMSDSLASESSNSSEMNAQSMNNENLQGQQGCLQSTGHISSSKSLLFDLWLYYLIVFLTLKFVISFIKVKRV